MKKNNIKIKLRLKLIVSVLLFGLITGSCEKYLDKAPEADISDKDAFGNFPSFQGFVEEMYNCIVDVDKMGWWIPIRFGDEVLTNSPYPFDQGNYWAQSQVFYSNWTALDDDNYNKRIWPLCWYGIRKANLALSKLEFLVDATQEEKDLIKGQALFFRGWFHFELMRYWGGLPYIDTVLSSSGELKLPRLNYRETALKAAKDFEAAATLLPVRWDDTDAGQATLGDNKQRISKVFALSYLGKDLLFAASPMMNEESTGNASFDADLCKRAADAFAEAIKVCDESGAYKLLSWEKWTDNFWVWGPRTLMPGGTEVIMNPTSWGAMGIWWSRWGAVTRTTPAGLGGDNSFVEVPTANYVKNYGMANGLPIDDPASGFNPDDPWVNREPRFYRDIIVDGDQLVSTSAAGVDQYAQLYNGGRHKGGSSGSVTGYFYKKFSPIGCNQWDNKHDRFQCYIPYLRLADVYLMYAEAVLQGYGSPSSAATGSSLTAVEAINIIRNRAQLPDLTSSYGSGATKDKFMEVIIRERAVELAFELQRFCDLRRWNLSGVTKYKEKTAIDFDRDSDGKPVNIKERVVITRVVEKKHNWLPFQLDITKLYEEFPQNPGW